MIEIELKTVRNIRDLGETITKNGKRIRRNKLIRSAHLADLSQEDMNYLKREHHLDTVIDLRTYKEVKEKPDCFYDLNYFHIPIVKNFEDGITHEKKEVRRFPDLTQTYIELVNREDYLQGFYDVLTKILERKEEEGAVLWHCSEGKDRCGLTSMLIEMILGVDEDVIRKDYLFTNKVNQAKAEKIYEEVFGKTGSEEIAASIYKAFIADESYLDAALSYIKEDFFENKLKLDPKLIEEFRNKILV
ncbi:MAG: tyrosine-protein phosphatase [Erysipelotrichaceae bacterium]|nr:tyrosine-protein phosphatase [Erysipelotrichaceae bacterium]